MKICGRNSGRWGWSTVGVVPLWSVKDVLCPTVAKTSAPRVASQGKTSPELLEGSLRAAEVVEGIAMWGYACGQPKRINLLGRLPYPHKALFKRSYLRRWGVQGGLPWVLDIVVGRTPYEGSLAATLVLILGGNNDWCPRWGPCWSFACDLACS